MAIVRAPSRHKLPVFLYFILAVFLLCLRPSDLDDHRARRLDPAQHLNSVPLSVSNCDLTIVESGLMLIRPCALALQMSVAGRAVQF